MGRSSVIVLDLDGVILKSNLIKYRAMLSLFDDMPEHRDAISAFILANGGVPRKEKITTILEQILGSETSSTLVSDYLARYAIALEVQLLLAPLVEGVAEFLGHSEYTFYVSSSAPEGEVKNQLERTGLLNSFAAIFGSDTPKANALREVKRRHPGVNPIFFGDSVGDLRAAQEARVAFVAVVNERDNFPNHDVVKISNFTAIETIERSIHQALCKSA